MKRLRIDIFLMLGVLALVGLGIVIIYSSSAAFAQSRGLPDSFYLVNHIKKVIIGFVAFLIGLSVPYKTWENLARPVMYLAAGLLLVVALMGISAHGARRWISFASFGLQPSELAKVAMVFFLAKLLTDKADDMPKLGKGFIASMAFPMVVFLLILKQPNYSTAATVLAITVAMVFAGGARIAHMVSLGLLAVPALGVLMVSSAYRLKRVMAFLHPENNPASSYQSLQALISLGNGGLFGTGLGTSTQKLGYLPMPFTDTIFSILGEELGLIGTALCLALFALVVWRGLRVSFHCPDRFGSLVALGVTVSLSVNVIMHVGVCAKFFPTTGQTLPFVSYGGTSLVASLFAMGVLLNISGHSLDSIPESWKTHPQKWQMLAGAARAKPGAREAVRGQVALGEGRKAGRGSSGPGRNKAGQVAA